VAPVEQIAASTPARPLARQARHWWLEALGASLVVGLAVWRIAASSHAIRLAVLPFENLTGEAADRVTALGLTDEMRTQLGAADPGHLAVIGPTSAARYAAAKGAPPSWRSTT
jgi:TolB-like protein